MSAPDYPLNSAAVRIVLFQSIAMSLDAQGRGIQRSDTDGFNIGFEGPQQQFTFNGMTYKFEKNEFPEFDAFMVDRLSNPSGVEASELMTRIRKLGEQALASLPTAPK
jgi:hypothetical protein